MLVEELEPRILYSADAAALLNPAALVQSAEIRPLDGYATPTDASAPGALTVESSAAQSNATEQSMRREIVFIDTAISGYEQLLADLYSDPGRAVETVLLDDGASGIERISQALATQSEIDTIHIVSHGVGGAIELGSATLDSAALDANADAIRAWGDALG